MNYKKHSDNRRDLHEYEYPVTKILEAKEDCELGNHYHKLKDEVFLITNGQCTAIVDDKIIPMVPFIPVDVKAGAVHKFVMLKGTVLVGFCTRAYDSTDDYHVRS